ncbi:MAG: HypC/HybG/HupF family hydrogenase formation chaperone [Bacteroidales bacterium]|nr:HypC/HybG/HupF family hydrogenase formation chaperone [Bacteroidales bacterium]
MCLAVPGKIISIDNSNSDFIMAKVSFGGAVKDISIQWLPEAKIGDYIVAHVGTAIEIINKEEAELAIKTANDFANMLEIEDENHLI